jgi:phage tail sheath protein FI
VIRGALGVEHLLTDADQNTLNPKGVNLLRIFGGNVTVWGARTLAADTDTEWRYLSTRRLVNYVEESLKVGLRWAVFEPNTLTLRQQIRRAVSGFLNGVWRDGALFGETAEQSYSLRFPESFNTDNDRALGKLTLEVGLRVAFPAEFIIVRIGLILQDPTAA